MIINRLSLPQPFVDAATSRHEYKPNRYSVTEVIGGTCEAILKRRHVGEGQEDVSDRLWAILGTAVHKVIESAESGPQQHQEQWLCVKVGDYELSGIFDLYDESTGTVTDWKVTSVWQVMFGDYEKWRMQTMAYCWMLREKGRDAHRGQIVAMLRDHQKRKAMMERDYPPHPVHVMEWEFTDDDLDGMGIMIDEWFRLAREQERREDLELDPCSPAERWHKPDKWAVVKGQNKRATRVFESQEEADALCAELTESTGKPYRVDFRPGEDTRCQSYCSVAQFCPHGRKFFRDSENSQTNCD